MRLGVFFFKNPQKQPDVKELKSNFHVKEVAFNILASGYF